MARLSERHGDVSYAEKIYEKLAERDPGNAVAQHRLGVIKARRGEFAAARAHFENAQKTSPKDVELLCDIGYLSYLQSDLAGAERSLRGAIAVDSQHKRAHNTLGQVLAEQGRFDDSLNEFRRAVSESEALANLAYLQLQLGAVSEAEKNYHRALDLDHNLKTAAEGLVQLASIQGRTKLQPMIPREAIARNESGDVQEVSYEVPHQELAQQVAPQPAKSNSIAKRESESIITEAQESTPRQAALATADKGPVLGRKINASLPEPLPSIQREAQILHAAVEMEDMAEASATISDRNVASLPAPSTQRMHQSRVQTAGLDRADSGTIRSAAHQQPIDPRVQTTSRDVRPASQFGQPTMLNGSKVGGQTVNTWSPVQLPSWQADTSGKLFK